MKRKGIASLLTVGMLAGCLAGCGSQGDVQEQTNERNGQESPATATSSDEKDGAETDLNSDGTGFPIVSEPLTLKVMLCIRDVDTLMDINEMPVMQELEEKTGIHAEWEIYKEADWSTKTNLMFASGEYPDIILCPIGSIDDEEYGVVQGIVIPLEELIEEYMPIYTERVDAEEIDPTIGLIASDGHRYSVGQIDQTGAIADYFTYINQTWLDNLNLKTPTSVEELTDVLRAFKTQDPNKNGEADEVPAEIALKTDPYGVRYLLPMFGVPCYGKDWLFIDDDRQVQLVPAQEGFRNCMEWLHTLYEEELVDAEVLSQDANTVDAKLAEGNAGFFTAYRLVNKGWDDGVARDAVLFTPIWTEGARACVSKKIEFANDGAYITKTNEHVAESLRWLDAMLETETMWSMRYGRKDGIDGEGTGWTYNAEGKVESMNNNTVKVLPYLGSNTLFAATAGYKNDNFVTAPNTLERLGNCNAYIEAGIMQKYSNSLLDLVALTPQQSEECSRIKTDINNTVNEWLATFVTQGVTDESWNTFVGLFEGMKAYDYVEIYQKGLNAVDFE